MTLRVLLHDILAELDPDGGGFRTSEAAERLDDHFLSPTGANRVERLTATIGEVLPCACA